MPRRVAQWKIDYVAALKRMSNEEIVTEALEMAHMAGSDQAIDVDQIRANLCDLELRIRLVESGFLTYSEIINPWWS